MQVPLLGEEDHQLLELVGALSVNDDNESEINEEDWDSDDDLAAEIEAQRLEYEEYLNQQQRGYEDYMEQQRLEMEEQIEQDRIDAAEYEEEQRQLHEEQMEQDRIDAEEHAEIERQESPR